MFRLNLFFVFYDLFPSVCSCVSVRLCIHLCLEDFWISEYFVCLVSSRQGLHFLSGVSRQTVFVFVQFSCNFVFVRLCVFLSGVSLCSCNSRALQMSLSRQSNVILWSRIHFRKTEISILGLRKPRIIWLKYAPAIEP